MKPDYDFSTGERGRFYHRNAKLTRPALDPRLEEAYQADGVETDRINREWEAVDADIDSVSGSGQTKAPARTRPSREV